MPGRRATETKAGGIFLGMMATLIILVVFMVSHNIHRYTYANIYQLYNLNMCRLFYFHHTPIKVLKLKPNKRLNIV